MKSFPRIMLAVNLGMTSFAALSQSISFDHAWTVVQENSSAIAAERSNVERYQNLQNADKSLNLPKIDLAGNYTRLDQDVTLSSEQIAGSIEGFSLPSGLPNVTSTIANKEVFTSSIRAIWPIFTGGKISAAQGAAEGKAAEATSMLKMKFQAKYEDLSTYYFGAVLAGEVLTTYQAVEDGLRRHRDSAVKLEEQGQIAKIERLQAEASLDKAKVDRKKAQHNLDIALLALKSLLSASGDTGVQSAEPSTPLFINNELPPIATYIDQTLETYPGLALLEAKEKQAQNLAKSEKGKYYPDVFLYGDYRLHEDDTLASQVAPDWMVGIGVSIPILDTSGRSNRLKAANSAIQQIYYTRLQAKQDLSLLVSKTYNEAEQAIDEVEGLASSLALASENLRLRQRAFSQGLSTSLAVVDAQLFLASVQSQQALAKFNYLVALNKLLALSSEMDTFTQYELGATARI